MADQYPDPSSAPTAAGSSAAVAAGRPPAAPAVLPWALVYTLGRLVVAAALVGLLWAVGLAGFPGMLFGLLLSMPVAYVLLRPARDKLTAALAARSVRKHDLRARLRGTDAEDAA